MLRFYLDVSMSLEHLVVLSLLVIFVCAAAVAIIRAWRLRPPVPASTAMGERRNGHSQAHAAATTPPPPNPLR